MCKQESGNVEHVVSRGFGKYVGSNSKRTAECIAKLVIEPDHNEMAAMRAAALSQDRSDSALDIARDIHDLLQ